MLHPDFRDKICHVFSTSNSNDGNLTFDDFLDMMSAFSDEAPKSLKAEYAFKVYGKSLMINILCVRLTSFKKATIEMFLSWWVGVNMNE